MGDDRSTAQLVADHFVACSTGQVTAARTPVAVNPVVSAETLLGGDDEPADLLTGPRRVHGPVPASVARGPGARLTRAGHPGPAPGFGGH